MKKPTKKVAAISMRKKAEKELAKSSKNPNDIFKLVKFVKKDGIDIGKRCTREKERKLGY